MADQTRENVIEIIVNVLRAMTTMLGKLQDNFRSMYDLIEIEHECIKKNDLPGVEKNLVDKSRICGEIVHTGEDISVKCRMLKELLSTCKVAGVSAISLSEIVGAIKEFAGQEQGGLHDKILVNTIERFTEKMNEFASERARVVPKVEMNSYLLNRLIKQHQKIRLVFQRGVDELRSVYDARGVTSSKDPLPILQVRA